MIAEPVILNLGDGSEARLLYSNGAARRIKARLGHSLLQSGDGRALFGAISEDNLSAVVHDCLVVKHPAKDRWVHVSDPAVAGMAPAVEELDELIVSQKEAIRAIGEAIKRANPPDPAPEVVLMAGRGAGETTTIIGSSSAQSSEPTE